MNKLFIRQIVIAVALAVVASGFNSAQAQTPTPTPYTPQYTPVLSSGGTYLTGLPLPDVVLQKKNTTQYKIGIPWDNEQGWWVKRDDGSYTEIYDPLVALQGKNCYVQDYYKIPDPANPGSYTGTIGGPLELRTNSQTEFWGNALFVGVNTYVTDSSDPNLRVKSTFTNNQMRFSISIDATQYAKESDMVYDPDKAFSMDTIYLGNGYINNRLNEAKPTSGTSGESGSSDSTDKPYYAVVGLKGTVYVLPDTNNDDVYRSKITNNNRNRHLVIDEACTMICPEGAKLELESFSLDANNTELPFALFPICGNVKGNGKVLYHSKREDIIYVLGNNAEFTGKTTIHTEWDPDKPHFNHAYVVSGDGTSYTGIKGSEIFIENGNLVLQNNHILNNLGSARTITDSSDPENIKIIDAAKHTRIIGSDAVTTNPFVAGYHYPDAAHHDQTELLILRNDKDTTYYGAIMKGHEQEINAVDEQGAPILDEQGNQVRYHNYAYINHNYAYTGDTKDFEELRKEGAATLKLYCAGSDGGIRAESFVVSSGQVDFNGYFKGELTVKSGAAFAPDSWNWGNDDAIAKGDNSVIFYAADGTTIVERHDAVTLDGDVYLEGGAKLEFHFSKYDQKDNDVITITEGHTFNVPDGVTSIIDLSFTKSDPYAWATEDAEYLLIKGGGFPLEETDYSDWLINSYGNMQTLRQFGLMGKDGNLYLVTRYYVPEPSTWAMMILGVAGLLYWRKKNR